MTIPGGLTAMMMGGVASTDTTYEEEVLSDNPIGYWRLGESSGTTANDISGNGLDGTYTSVTLGTTGLISGDSDTAATFNGTSSRIQVADNALLDVTDISVEAWIKTSDKTSSRQILCRDSSSGESQRQFQFRVTGSTGVLTTLIFAEGGSLTGNLSGAVDVADGVKHHVGFSYDSTTFELKLYLDGINIATNNGSAALDKTITEELMIGCRKTGSSFESFFNGVIDEPAIYGHVLGDARFLAHYNKGA